MRQLAQARGSVRAVVWQHHAVQRQQAQVYEHLELGGQGVQYLCFSLWSVMEAT